MSRLSIKIQGLGALTLALMLSACSTSARRAPGKERRSAAATGSLSMSNMAEGHEVMSPEATPKAAAPAKTPKPAATSKQDASAAVTACADVLRRLVPIYAALHQKLPPHARIDLAPAHTDLLAARPEHCHDPATRAKVLEALRGSVHHHSGRVGLILPLSGPRARVAAHVVQGMRIAYKDAGLDFDTQVIVKDSGESPTTAEMRLAELLFKERPSLVVGGLDPGVAELLARRGAELLMPTVVLSRDPKLTERSPFVFSIYPDERRLAETLARAGQKRGYKRYAILRPAGGKSNRIAEHFRSAVLASGGHVIHDLIYTSGDFGSMQGASRQLFQTDVAARVGEYRAAYQRAKQEAEAAGQPFNPRMVVLKPIVDFDAVFLPDDFRTVRHFAKLFKYHGVERLPMIGNHEWRSPALIEPYEEFLDGSLFADFIPSYAGLPAGVSAPTMGSPYFVHPRDVVPVDFRLVGYRIGRTTLLGLSKKPTTRRHVPAALGSLVSDSAAYFGRGPVFGADRQSRWPTYVFTIDKGQLVLEPEQLTASTEKVTSRR